ncbi:MAG: hypothetical protein DLM66_03485 [Candidatus Dormiibacter spiritus]|nr:MAG: hypothetical protein DLM66_03485 [Candidatus Dormibacteraeota bacterium]
MLLAVPNPVPALADGSRPANDVARLILEDNGAESTPAGAPPRPDAPELPGWARKIPALRWLSGAHRH